MKLDHVRVTAIGPVRMPRGSSRERNSHYVEPVAGRENGRRASQLSLPLPDCAVALIRPVVITTFRLIYRHKSREYATECERIQRSTEHSNALKTKGFVASRKVVSGCFPSWTSPVRIRSPAVRRTSSKSLQYQQLQRLVLLGDRSGDKREALFLQPFRPELVAS
jgi:rhodanese-related sulfurtransferase